MTKVRRIPGPGAEALKVALKNLDGKVGKVGWFPDSRYEDGTPVAYVATIQEFGSPQNGIPPRSFMRTTIQDKQGEWADLAASGARAVLAGNADIGQVMSAIGQAAEGDIRQKIASITAPPLAASTIAARRRKVTEGTRAGGNFSKPLIDTGLMIKTISSTVEDS